MGVSNCKRCGKIFNYVVGQRICEGCRKELEVMFQQVKEYIRENPNQGIKDVSEGTEVPESIIQQWVREERLEFSKGAGVLSCEKCGAPIATGRFCDRCKSEMSNNLTAAVQPQMDARRQAALDAAEAAFRNQGGMRFINN